MLEKFDITRKSYYRIILSSFISLNSLILLILTIVLSAKGMDVYTPITIYLSIISFIFAALNLLNFFIRTKQSNLWFAIFLIEFPLMALIGIVAEETEISTFTFTYFISTFLIVGGAISTISHAYYIFAKKINSFIYKTLFIISIGITILGIFLVIFMDSYFEGIFTTLLISLFIVSFALSTAFLIGLIFMKRRFGAKFIEFKNDYNKNRKNADEFKEI